MAQQPDATVDQTTPEVDPQKQYLMDQFGGLMEQVGEGFGRPLQEELIHRLEQTIADFHEEVNEMLISLKENSEKRHSKLKEIWDNPDAAFDEEEDNSDVEQKADSFAEMSEYEKRIEAISDAGKKEVPKEEEQKPKKKKGFFGRKKK
mgnify:CR=1 FL=1